MALARPASTIIPKAPVPSARPAPFSPAALVVHEPRGVAVQTAHIRRCTWRRVTALPRARRELQMYDVDCLHPTYDAAVPLGHLEAARDACADCILPGVFRADED